MDRGVANPRRQKEERREKRGEKREKRKTEDRPQEAAKEPQIKPPDNSTPCRPLLGPLAASCGSRGQREESKEKREDRIEKQENCRHLDSLHSYGPPAHRKKIMEIEMAPKNAASSTHCISTVPRGHHDDNKKDPNGRLKICFAKNVQQQGEPRRWPQARFPACLRCPAATPTAAKTRQQKKLLT